MDKNLKTRIIGLFGGAIGFIIGLSLVYLVSAALPIHDCNYCNIDNSCKAWPFTSQQYEKQGHTASHLRATHNQSCTINNNTCIPRGCIIPLLAGD